jgi:hypothetical protein
MRWWVVGWWPQTWQVLMRMVVSLQALIIKDLAKTKHAPGVAAVLETANKIANCVSDCEAIRTLLHECQKDAGLVRQDAHGGKV